MAERVIVSRPLNTGCIGYGTVSVKLRVTSRSFNNTITVRFGFDPETDADVIRALYDEAVYDKLVSVGIPTPIVTYEDDLFGAIKTINNVTEKTHEVRIEPTERIVVEKTHEVRIEPHVEQRVIERAVVKYEPISGWLLLATGGIGGALGVAAKIAWVALFL